VLYTTFVTDKFCPLVCWYDDSLVYERPCTQLIISIPIFIEKCIIICAGLPPPSAHLTSCPTETPNILRPKSYIHFPSLSSFQRIRPSSRPCVTFRNTWSFTVECCWRPAYPPRRRTTRYWLYATAYSIYMLPSTYGNRLLYPRPEDAPCRGNRTHLSCMIRHVLSWMRSS
jgi:hypothetical protein